MKHGAERERTSFKLRKRGVRRENEPPRLADLKLVGHDQAEPRNTARSTNWRWRVDKTRGTRRGYGFSGEVEL